MTVDYRTGDAILDLAFDKNFGSVVFSTSGSVAVPVQLAQIATNVNELASLSGLIQTAVGAVAGGIASFLVTGMS